MNYLMNILDNDAGSLPALIEEQTHCDHPREDGLWVFDPPLVVYDVNDPDDGPLYLLYGDREGGTFWAPDCPDENEAERRVIRSLGLDVTIDDMQPEAERPEVS